MSLSHWNYRVVEDVSRSSWRICEVYYDENGEDVVGWSDAHAAEGDTLDDMRSDFDNQKDCLFEIHYHIVETEDGDEKLVPWREDGNYEDSY